MSEVVKRVSEAISDAVAKWQPESGVSIKEAAARAAIEAMRRPTGTMCQAATRTEKRVGEAGPVEVNYMVVAYDIWPKMIDEALK